MRCALAVSFCRGPGSLMALAAPVLVAAELGEVVARGLGFLVGGSGSAGSCNDLACFQVIAVWLRVPVVAAVGENCTAAAMGWVVLGLLVARCSRSFRSLRSCRDRMVIAIQCLVPIRDWSAPRVGGCVGWWGCRETAADGSCLGCQVVPGLAGDLARSHRTDRSCRGRWPADGSCPTSRCGALCQLRPRRKPGDGDLKRPQNGPVRPALKCLAHS